MSPRSDGLTVALLAAVLLGAVTGAIRTHGIRIGMDLGEFDPRSVAWLVLTVQVATFLTGTLAVLAIGYHLGGGSNPHREFLPVGAALFAGGLVGIGLGALVPMAVFPPDSLGRVASLLQLFVSLGILAVQFALAGLAGFAAGTFLGDRRRPADAGTTAQG